MGHFLIRVQRDRNIAPKGQMPEWQPRMETLLSVPGDRNDQDLINALRLIKRRMEINGPAQIEWRGIDLID